MWMNESFINPILSTWNYKNMEWQTHLAIRMWGSLIGKLWGNKNSFFIKQLYIGIESSRKNEDCSKDWILHLNLDWKKRFLKLLQNTVCVQVSIFLDCLTLFHKVSVTLFIMWFLEGLTCKAEPISLKIFSHVINKVYLYFFKVWEH